MSSKEKLIKEYALMLDGADKYAIISILSSFYMEANARGYQEAIQYAMKKIDELKIGV